MRKLIAIAVTCAVAALGAGSAIAGQGNGHGHGNGNGNGKPSVRQVASRLCVTEQHTIGVKAFKAKYGKHAMRTCKRQQAPQAQAQIRNAAQACRAEAADPNFATTHGGQTFDQFYGTNHNDKNAFGKCVSSKVPALHS